MLIISYILIYRKVVTIELVLVDLLNDLTLDTVVNIEFNREIIDSFSVKDFYTSKKINYLSRYNSPIKSVYFNNEKNVTVEIKKKSQIGVEKKELICYKDGSFTLDNKPFENIVELTNYLSWN